ncbi:two-component system sensor histidine kinase NtrB [Desulfobulbus alkaliphilus]|uniref:two-component system sensor histidine kinase NtrB n=1 Tax=Desulfobulbus alkaliphilus TaxID=869814 RepID=UPI001963F2D8|nr:PAS domain-containing sensor histidine kinase [Desulfobulbus alkaliphilus]MBM9535656.1 PAS domain-containing protein [Desulfobulbus alkaliphilus]
MENKKHQPGDLSALRKWAEEIARRKTVAKPGNLALRSSQEIEEMFHELRVYQIELEIQNEELRQTQMELEASRALLADLYDYAPVGYITENQAGVIVEANLTVTTLLNIPWSELIRIPLSRFILPEDQDIYYRHRKQLQETRAPQVCELRMLRSSISPFWARLEAIAARDHAGMPLYRVILSDVTAYKKAEEGRERLKKQLAQIEKMESIERLAGGVANDFNNMLGIILGNAEMALDHVDPEQPFFANLQEIGKAVDRSANLTWQLLSFARMQTVATEGLDLNETVAVMMAMLRRVAGSEIDLVWIPEPGLWPVTMNVPQIEQILVNLCSNARDAITGRGQITIEVKNTQWKAEDNVNQAGFPLSEYVMITVSDNGYGMGGNVIDKMFEPFFTTKKKGQSAGLGLAIVHGLVTQNNGFINVYSEPDQGTTFNIYLPRHAATVLIRIPKADNNLNYEYHRYE